MSMLYKFIGIVLGMGSLVFAIASIVFKTLDIAVFGVYLLFISSLIYRVGDLSQRVRTLESEMEKALLKNADNDDNDVYKISLLKCSKCGREYDSEFSSCPYCDVQTEFKKKQRGNT